MNWIRRFAVATCLLALASACSGGGEVVLDDAREAVNGSDGGAETILAPDFEVELEPGQDPDEVLAGPTPTSPPAPDDAIGVLCPAAQAVIAGTGTDADVAAVRSAAPSEWAGLLADLGDPVGRSAEPAVAGLDRWLYDACSFPLFASIDQLAAGCTEPGCRADRIDGELGGLCVDDGGDAGSPYRLLSCVSGLPANG